MRTGTATDARGGEVGRRAGRQCAPARPGHRHFPGDGRIGHRPGSRAAAWRAIYFAEKNDGGKLVLRRGFAIAPGEKMLVVEDVVTKGGRVQETLDIVRAHGGTAVGVAMIVDRSNGAVSFGVPAFSLISLKVEAFEPDQLPPDLANIPAVKPGAMIRSYGL